MQRSNRRGRLSRLSGAAALVAGIGVGVVGLTSTAHATEFPPPTPKVEGFFQCVNGVGEFTVTFHNGAGPIPVRYYDEEFFNGKSTNPASLINIVGDPQTGHYQLNEGSDTKLVITAPLDAPGWNFTIEENPVDCVPDPTTTVPVTTVPKPAPRDFGIGFQCVNGVGVVGYGIKNPKGNGDLIADYTLPDGSKVTGVKVADGSNWFVTATAAEGTDLDVSLWVNGLLTQKIWPGTIIVHCQPDPTTTVPSGGGTTTAPPVTAPPVTKVPHDTIPTTSPSPTNPGPTVPDPTVPGSTISVSTVATHTADGPSAPPTADAHVPSGSVLGETVSNETLPRTGASHTSSLVLTGTFITVLGLALLVAGRRKRSTSAA